MNNKITKKNNWREYEFNEFVKVLKKPKGLKTKDYQSKGFPIFDQSDSKYISAYTEKENYVYDFSIDNPVILFGDHSRTLKFIIQKSAFGNDGIKLFQRKENFDTKFIYFKLLTQKIPNTGYNRHFKYLKDEVFKLPPLPEQKRIVGVLEVWDEVLEKLKRKIEIKKNIKKGLLQKMLTCKKRVVNGKEVFAPELRVEGFEGDWVEKRLKDVCDFKKCSGLSKKLISENGKNKCILYGEIYTTYSEYIKDVKSRTDSSDGVLSKKGDILIPASTTTSHLDLAVATTVFEDDILLGGDINILRKKNENDYDNIFLALYLTYARKHELARLAQGVTIIHLYGNHFKKLKINLPPLPEQKRIVGVLEVWDEVLEKLKRKIEVKKNIKKGLLQKMLTCKKRVVNGKEVFAPELRVEGFEGDWVERKLGEIVDIKKGTSFTKKELVDGKIPVIAGGKEPAYFHNKSNFSEKTITVSASGAYAGFVSKHIYPIFASDCSVIKNKEVSCFDFIYEFLKFKQEWIYFALQVGGAQPHVYPKDLKIIKINTPSLEEQEAIAAVLTAADEEIDELLRKQKLLEEQKKYLLNVLISGEIRVPEGVGEQAELASQN